MNFKISFFFLAILTCLTGCGVKGPPQAFPDTLTESYTREYTGSDLSPEEKARMENKTAIPSALDPKQSTTTQPTVIKP